MTAERRDKAITREGWAAAQEKQRADIAANPQQAAMAAALKHTKEEQVQLAAADAKVTEAEAAVNEAGVPLSRARRGLAPVREQDASKPFTFFQKRPETHRAAMAAVPGLTADLAEARTHLQNAIRRRNGIGRAIERARMERRQAAKLSHSPKRAPVRSLADGWSSGRAMNRWSGGKDAA